MPRVKNFLPLLLGTALVLASFTALSCNGNGGASDSEGEVYTGGGTSSSSGPSGSSSGGSSSNGISAMDYLSFSNSSEGMETLVDRLTSGTMQNAGAGTQTVTFIADTIGLPSGGTATLTISGGGCNYSGLATADANGNVNFEIPMIVSGSTITVGLTVKNSAGVVLYAGSREQTVSGDSSQIAVSLTRQYWLMPSGISVTASPDTLAYDPATLDSDTITFNIIGLTGAPADVSYSWTDESGAVVGSGATLTRTVNEMLGAGFVPMNDSEEQTYTVTASYTDASGTAKTLTASATATIVTTATIRLTASGIQSEGGRQFIVIPKTASSVPITPEVLCFAGTPTYTWSNVGVGFTSFMPGVGDSNNIGGPWDGGKSTITVNADLGDGRTLTKELDVYVLEARISGADVPSGATDPIVLEKATGVSTVLTARLWETGSELAGLSGVEYTWDVDDIAVATASPSGGTSTTITPAGTGAATVKATISYKGVSVEATRSLVVAALKITSTSGFVYKWDPAMATQTMHLTVALDGVPSSDAGSVTYNTGDYGSSDTTVATATAGGTPYGTDITVAIDKGGLTTINAKATYKGKPFTAEQEITVLHLILGGTDLHHVTTGTPPATRDLVLISPAVMDGTTEVAPSVTADLTMTLEGLTADSYEWESNTPLSCTVSPTNMDSTTVSPSISTATGYVNAKATYNGEEISVLQQITVAALSLNGANFLNLDRSAPGNNRFQCDMDADGIALADLDTASISYTSVDTALATVLKGGEGVASSLAETSCLVTGLDAGTATIKVTATETLTGADIELTGIKKVSILELVIKDYAGKIVPATGSTIPMGSTAGLEAVLNVPSAGGAIDYAWTVTGTAVSLSSTVGNTTSVTGLTEGKESSITVTATYDGNDYTKTVKYGVPEGVSLDDFSTYMSSKPTSSFTGEPVPSYINVTGITSSNYTQLQFYVSNLYVSTNAVKYVDLSATQWPSGITDLNRMFDDSPAVIAGPEVIPEGVTNMAGYHEFVGISSESKRRVLRGPKVIPSTVRNMSKCFYNCSMMSGEIYIKSTRVTDWTNAFYGCATSGGLLTLYVANDTVKNNILTSGGAAGNDNIIIKVKGTDFDDWP